ncbi:MAG: amidohydrolase [Acidobacteriota bacterium]|nr:amidohydrolase [Acidobacteriota bacterium]MDH3529487.1 amidohydrolase [Acidobacteriota bacterium]
MKKRVIRSTLLVAVAFSLALTTIARSAAVGVEYDLLIVGGTVVTMNPGREVIENGAVAIKDGKIGVIGHSETIPTLRAKQIINAEGKLVIPGLINTHTHVPMTLFRGIADDLDLQQWLETYIFPAEARNVDENFVRVGTRLGLAEMIRGGTTTYTDMYYFESAIAEETSLAGLRAVLGETVIDFPAPDNKTFEEGLKYTERFLKKWQNDPLITPAVAPHAPYTVSEAHLKDAEALSKKHSAPLLIHLAEAETEVDFVRKNKNMRPVEYADKIGILSERTIAAHVIQVNDAELDVLKARGVGVAHNPESNMKLAAGVAPVPAMIRKGLRVGLGTDGAASNNDLSLWEEMDTAAKLHKIFSRDPKAASAQEMFELATIGGASALHMEEKIGSLEVGKLADIVLVDMDGLHQTPLYNVYSHLVYAVKSADVATVIVNGRILMLNRTLLTLNEIRVKKEANDYQEKIVASLKGE